MDKDFEIRYHDLEERHWWFRARRDIILRLISNMDLPDHANVLDVGCSGGPLIKQLVTMGFEEPIGIDISEEGVALAKRRGHPGVAVMSGARLGFADKTFDLVIASDVLEHIDRDGEALCEWHRVMRPGGRLIVFVPAFMMLWSSHDEVNRHFRRYRAAQLRALLERAEFVVERSFYWNTTLFAPVAAVRLLNRLFPVRRESVRPDDLSLPNRLLNAGLFGLMKMENILLGLGTNFPFGVSVCAIVRKEHAAISRVQD